MSPNTESDSEMFAMNPEHYSQSESNAKSPANSSPESNQAMQQIDNGQKEILNMCIDMMQLVEKDDERHKHLLEEEVVELFQNVFEERLPQTRALQMKLDRYEEELIESELELDDLLVGLEKQMKEWDAIEQKLEQADRILRKFKKKK